MLKHTFLHLPGIGSLKERALWRRGILNWDDFDRFVLGQHSLFPDASSVALRQALDASREALRSEDFDYFAERLPRGEHYRIALTAPAKTVFLDIETTGLSLYYDSITIIGLSNSVSYKLFVRGQSVDEVATALEKTACIVTFNGGAFDLKFIRKEFPELRIPKAHVDLRFLGQSVGLRGSQKKVERELALVRSDEVREVVGETAPLLWYKYCLGDIASGKLLVEYNHADVHGMKLIFDEAAGRRVGQGPLATLLSKRHRFFGSRPSLRWSAKEPPPRGRIYIPPFTGRVGPRITSNELIAAGDRPLRAVGIDLTGSEKRPTGWCLLSGDVAETRLLRTDKEILNATIAASPDLVSIDSPLSLPKGRKSVHNSDPGRYKYGIMRECERILKRRGVNVYPSLIDSMQALTARGSRLAQQLRTMGIPVIESYPGAAQDIMGIPRKRAGLDYLKQGLAKFGITGEFTRTKVSHDEVDAITSSVVGLFFWAGRFEALGNPDEEYLIIPDLNVAPDPWQQRVVIGISGAIASGKTEGARYLESNGFHYGRYSQVLAEVLREKGQEPTRENLQAFGERVNRKRGGQRWLSSQLVHHLPADKNLVIDGLRFPEDHAYLVETFGPAFHHVHVTASEGIRRARYVRDGGTRAEFDKAITHPVESQIPHLRDLAHIQIENEGLRETYHTKLRRIVRLRSKIGGELFSNQLEREVGQ